MNIEWLNMLYFATIFLLLFGVADILHVAMDLKPGLTRKIVHLVTGLIVLVFPYYFSNHLSVMILCAAFFVLLLLSMYFNFLPSINKVKRKTLGSLYFPISIYFSFYIYTLEENLIFFLIPMAILAVSDTLAELIGSTLKWKPYRFHDLQKTWGGSIAFFVSSFVISLIILRLFQLMDFDTNILISLSIAMVTTVFEAFSHRGIDNLTIPLGAILVLYFIQHTILI
ncbi:MAG: phosphatidate cytidylyltransferase [Brumimicrobium sp.]|nr:phosphatidate cytidylyltransferase [Brumimicrobium sp.]